MGTNRWILSPTADGALIIGAPLLCVMVVLALASLASPFSVWVAVMAFGAVGHHLPGFLRTYGNRELFRRYRARLLVAPPLVFVVTLWFAHRNLHGVALVALVWSIWHGMMQHYGFVRIYDAKAGSPRSQSGRLDLALTVSWFATCLVFGPHQSASIIDSMQTAGLPLPSATALRAVRIFVFAAMAATTVLYVSDVVGARRRGGSVSWQKLALVVTTTALVWFARVFTTNPYVSVALFELLHDVQYLAIVWAFNRRLVDTGRDDTWLAGTMFSRRRRALVFYIGACLVYGTIAFFTFTRMGDGAGKSILVAMLVTSGILHYYYDGFIWKLSRLDTREGLRLDGTAKTATAASPSSDRRSLVHMAAFLVVVGVLAGTEVKRGPADPLAAARAVVELVPDSPTSHYNLGDALLGAGRPGDAIPHLREAIRRQPDLAPARASLGHALLATGDTAGGIAALESAVAIEHHNAKTYVSLATARARAGDVEAAVGLFTRALELDPKSVVSHVNLGLLLARAGRLDDALGHFEAAVRLRPDLVEARNNLGGVLTRLGRTEEAIVQFRAALAIDPSFAPARHNLEKLQAR